LNNRWGEIDALDGLGWAARSLGSYQEARSHYKESYQIAKDSGHRWEMANALESLGFLSIFLGEFNQALERFHEAIAISEDLGLPYRSMPSRIHVGVASWLAGDFAKAESAILDSVSISAELTPASRIFPTICQAEYYTITGRYREAHAQFRLLHTLTEDVFLDRFLDGRLKRTIGWMALAETNYDLARQQFQESVELYRVDSDDEQIAWSQVGLAAAAIHQGKWEEAHQILIEALWTCIEIRAFIPLLFLMPIACLYLARENPSLAGRVFIQIRRSDFLCNAKIFYDIAYKHLPEEIVQQSGKSINPLSGADLRQHMWSTASNVLSSWIQVWMEDTETIQV
jgi:tetratricopeptide (TPR) repeat protein